MRAFRAQYLLINLQSNLAANNLYTCLILIALTLNVSVARIFYNECGISSALLKALYGLPKCVKLPE